MPTSPQIDPRRKRESFDTVASYYQRYRRGYPSEVVDDVVTSGGIGPGSFVLEIGCGTGQLSVPIAATGAELVCVELGSSLAAVARRNLASWPSARVENSTFEEWPLPDRLFDSIACATAFHWIDARARVEKTAVALRPGGKLVIVNGHHVLGGTAGFPEASQELYLKWGLSDDPTFELPSADTLPVMYGELAEGEEFEELERHRFEALLHFTTESLIGWMHTDSLILGVDEPARQGFLEDMRAFTDQRYGGEVTKRFLFTK